MSNILEEYLVKIGFDVRNNGAAAQAVNTINGITDALKRLGTALRLGGIAALFAKLTDSIVENIKSVADAELSYQKLAQEMWVTKDTAKALSVVLKTMGASEKDVAWVPELREQFFRLRGEMAALATPVDADDQLKWIRGIGYDIESLQIKFKMLKEWVVYYLIKYMEPMIKQFKEFIGWVNSKLGSNMPKIAKKIAEWLSGFMKMLGAGFRLVKNVFSWVWSAFESLPSKIKALVPAFMAAGAMIMAGPFGLMLTAIGGALLLLEDFFGFLDGKESSKTFTPLWKWLKEFSEGTGNNFLQGISNAFDEIYKSLEKITQGIDFEKAIANVKTGLKDIVKGFEDIVKAHGDMLKALNLDNPVIEKFFKGIGKAIEGIASTIGRLLSLIGKLMSAFALIMAGKYKEAAEVATGGVVGFAKDTAADTIKALKEIVFDDKKGEEKPTVVFPDLTDMFKNGIKVFPGLPTMPMLPVATEDGSEEQAFDTSGIINAVEKLKDFMFESETEDKTLRGKLIDKNTSIRSGLDVAAERIVKGFKDGLSQIKNIGSAFKNGLSGFFDGSGSISRAQQIVAAPSEDFLGNANGCTFFVKAALGDDNEFMKEVGDSLWVPDWVDKAKDKGRYHEGTEGMQKGDIIVYDYGQAGGFGDHVVLSDGQGGAYGNSSTQKKPMYYNDMHDIGKIAGYIRPGGNGQTYASEKANNAPVSEPAGLGGAFSSAEYSYATSTIGAVTINITAPNAREAAYAVRTTLEDMRGRMRAHNAGGPYK